MSHQAFSQPSLRGHPLKLIFPPSSPHYLLGCMGFAFGTDRIQKDMFLRLHLQIPVPSVPGSSLGAPHTECCSLGHGSTLYCTPRHGIRGQGTAGAGVLSTWARPMEFPVFIRAPEPVYLLSMCVCGGRVCCFCLYGPNSADTLISLLPSAPPAAENHAHPRALRFCTLPSLTTAAGWRL